MTKTIVVSGTDTDVGKTVFSAALTAALDGCYWKPVQTGVGSDGNGDSDSKTVARLTGLPAERILPEAYRLQAPLAPSIAAQMEGVTIYPQSMLLPTVDTPLVIEGAGGLMVPLTERILYIDVMFGWRAPVVLCARTTLGTINHSLLSLDALRRRGLPVLGVAFIGDGDDDAEAMIASYGAVPRLGRLPILEELNAANLRAAFLDNFSIEDFLPIADETAA